MSVRCTVWTGEPRRRAASATPAARSLAEPGRPGEERRVVSIVFVDLVGFTARSELLDPEDVRAILTPYYEHVRAELERFGGRVEKFIGDAVMGVFGAPTALETTTNGPSALRSRFATGRARRARGAVAVNTGEAIVELEARIGQGEAMIAGDVVNTAARLQTAAPVGAVLVGEDTYLSTRNVIEYQPGFEPVKAKGKAEPVHAWIAVRARVHGRRAPVDTRPDDRPHASARGLDRCLGARRRRASSAPRHRFRPGRNRQVAARRSSSWSSSGRGTRVCCEDGRCRTARRARTARSLST